MRLLKQRLLMRMFVTWLSSQDNETKQHINDMVRHIMALKRVVKI